MDSQRNDRGPTLKAICTSELPRSSRSSLVRFGYVTLLRMAPGLLEGVALFAAGWTSKSARK